MAGGYPCCCVGDEVERVTFFCGNGGSLTQQCSSGISETVTLNTQSFTWTNVTIGFNCNPVFQSQTFALTFQGTFSGTTTLLTDPSSGCRFNLAGLAGPVLSPVRPWWRSADITGLGGLLSSCPSAAFMMSVVCVGAPTCSPPCFRVFAALGFFAGVCPFTMPTLTWRSALITPIPHTCIFTDLRLPQFNGPPNASGCCEPDISAPLNPAYDLLFSST